MDLKFKPDECCGGYVTAEVTHDNGLRSVVEDKGNGVFTVLTFRAYMPHVPLVENLSRAEVDAELARVADTLARLGMPLEERSDKIAYIKHCCMFDVATEGQALMQALQQAITPRPEEVAAQIATFRSDVSGP